MPYVLALDQGTTSSRAILFDHDGGIASVAQREYTQLFPKSGWVEHDPLEIWSSQIAVATEVLGRARIRPRDIAAIGITNQRETTIIWDRATGQPIHNAIVWQDRRTSDICDRLKADGLRDARSRTIRPGHRRRTSPAARSPGCSTTSPGARARADKGELAFGTVD